MTASLRSEIEAALNRQPHLSGETALIEIHGPIRHLTALYEKLRTLLDYQEERFIRRLAIRRILFRRLVIEGSGGPIGQDLLLELIRAAYLENGRYPQQIAADIDRLIEKYRPALPALERRYAPGEVMGVQRRILGLAAAEIEDVLNPPEIEEVLVGRLAAELKTYLPGTDPEFLRLVSLRVLTKADAELATWRQLRTQERELWLRFDRNPATEVSGLAHLMTKTEARLRRADLESAVRRFQRLAPPYLLIQALIQEKGGQIATFLDRPNELDAALEAVIHARQATLVTRLRNLAIRATVYIFTTKIIVGLALEIPYALATTGRLDYLPLGSNILVPPLLMFLAVAGIRPPSRKNTELVTWRAKTLLSGETPPPLAGLEPTRRRSNLVQTVFSLLYLATYLLVFGGLIWLLHRLSFNWLEIVVFLFFLSVVGFFAFRIRGTANELAVIREREGVMLLIFDFLALPFLRVGRWLATTIRSLNVLLFVFDFILEAPLKLIFVAIEDWFAFLREKREELH